MILDSPLCVALVLGNALVFTDFPSLGQSYPLLARNGDVGIHSQGRMHSHLSDLCQVRLRVRPDLRHTRDPNELREFLGGKLWSVVGNDPFCKRQRADSLRRRPRERFAG